MFRLDGELQPINPAWKKTLGDGAVILDVQPSFNPGDGDSAVGLISLGFQSGKAIFSLSL